MLRCRCVWVEKEPVVAFGGSIASLPGVSNVFLYIRKIPKEYARHHDAIVGGGASWGERRMKQLLIE